MGKCDKTAKRGGSLGVPPFLEVRMFLSKGGTLGEGGSSPQGKSEGPSFTCHFSYSFSLKYSVCQGITFWGVVS